MRSLIVTGIFIGLLFSTQAFTDDHTSYVSIEGALAWQSKNDQRIPGNTGTQFSLNDFDNGPFKTYRIYAGKKINNKHEVRFLYAPLELELKGEFNKSIQFMGLTFTADVPTKAIYKFNSYRATYAYHFDQVSNWNLAFGFTGKIRDAKVGLTQGSLKKSKTNVGFVPLLNFQARRALSNKLTFVFDLDGLAAPQGRAFDAALFLERSIFNPRLAVFGGYRTVEGGADNDKVYNMAWFHYAVLGFKGYF